MNSQRHVHRLFAPAIAAAMLGLVFATGVGGAETNGPVPQIGASPPAQNGADAAPRRVVIRFLTDSDFPPFDFYDEDGVLVGFNVDLARAICLELNTSCDIKARPWDELFPGLNSGEAEFYTLEEVRERLGLTD